MENLRNKSEEEWKRELTPQQYQILREKRTEPAFTGAYWNYKEDGMYHCAACGAKLFSSKAKFDSGTGWPSFTQPVKSSPAYVYVLRMNNGQLYTGSTTDLAHRIREHRNGKVFTTKKYLPVVLIHYETYDKESEARQREKNLKHHGNAFAKLKEQIKNNREILLAGFTEPEVRDVIETREDRSHGMRRTEVLCKTCGGHLGHVFDDLPAQAGGQKEKGEKRYCINSCSLDFKSSV